MKRKFKKNYALKKRYKFAKSFKSSNKKFLKKSGLLGLGILGL